MIPSRWEPDFQKLAYEQWEELVRVLKSLGADCVIMPPESGSPDLVFTANAAVVLNRKAIMSRFSNEERQAEEAINARAFSNLCIEGKLNSINFVASNVPFEGAGDCVWDSARRCYWFGWGFRSATKSAGYVASRLDAVVKRLHLADPRFYHLDTAFCPLSQGQVIYYPGAFDEDSLRVIKYFVKKEFRIELTEEEACQFSANSVCFDNNIVMASVSERLNDILKDHGYNVVPTPLDIFHKAGGSAFCLTLCLSNTQ